MPFVNLKYSNFRANGKPWCIQVMKMIVEDHAIVREGLTMLLGEGEPTLHPEAQRQLMQQVVAPIE